MLTRALSAAAHAWRALCSAPLRWMPTRGRARALEALNSTMIVSTPTARGELKFFAPSPLLIARAGGVMHKETDMVRWLDSLPAGAVLWDIGANVGVFTLYAAARKDVTVLAFEPSAANYYALTRNIQINGFAERASAYCIAFSDASRLGTLNLHSSDMGVAVSQFGERGDRSRYWDASVVASSQGMLGLAVDEFIERFRPPFPTHLKMDVDGLEPRILEGARRTLADSRLREAMVELSLSNQAERAQAIEMLAAAGLVLAGQGEPQGMSGLFAANHLFRRGAD